MTSLENFEGQSIQGEDKTTGMYTRLTKGLLVAGVLLLTAVQLRRAWVSDDAFITFRTIDNFLHGYGLVWNIGERVQTFTHPLWMLVLTGAGALTHEMVFTSMILSILISLAALILLITQVAASPLSALFAVVVLTLANSFIDYSTSGLENALSHLLLVIFFVLYFKQTDSVKKIFWLSFVASLGALNRLDLMLIFIPPLLYTLYKTRQIKGILYLVLGQFPLITWEILSLIYYGFPFPNTAYAKLNTGIPALDLALQGLSYYRDSIHADPITLIIIASAVLLPFLTKNKPKIWISAGIVIYLIYIVKIGGDFMSGRFLAAPLLCSLVIISTYDLSSLPALQSGLLFAAVVIIGLLSPTPTVNFREADLTAKQRSTMVNNSKISNERRFYNWSNSLWRVNLKKDIPDHPYASDGIKARQALKVPNAEEPVSRSVARRITVGMFGYYAGPNIYVLDELALGDALLARLPAERVVDWRIGHFQRTIPDGYLETLRTGTNQLTDQNLAGFYDKLKLITQGKLFSPERLIAIWKMNTGQYNDLIDFNTYRFPKQVRVSIDEVNHLEQEGTAWDEPGNIQFQDSGIEVAFNETNNASRLGAGLAGGHDYQFQFINQGRVIAQEKISLSGKSSEMMDACVQIPEAASDKGFDIIRVFAITGKENTSLGYLSPDQCITP